MHGLQVNPQVRHAVRHLATDPARGEAHVDLAVVTQRVDVAVPPAAYVARMAI